MVQLADYEQTRDTSGTAYKQARQSAMARLQMFNRQASAAAAAAASQEVGAQCLRWTVHSMTATYCGASYACCSCVLC